MAGILSSGAIVGRCQQQRVRRYELELLEVAAVEVTGDYYLVVGQAERESVVVRRPAQHFHEN